MAYKDSCKCLPSSLKKILDEAISHFELEQVGTKGEEHERKMADINNKLDELIAMGLPISQVEAMKSVAIAKDPTLKQFDDLKEWSNQCECPPGTDFDWTQFPYHDIGYSAGIIPGTAKAGRHAAFKSVESQIEQGLCGISGISKEEALSDLYKVRALSELSLEALEKRPDVREYMNQKYPSGWAQASYKLELVKLGILSPQQYDEWNRRITDIKRSCSGKDLYNKWENDIYQLRRQLNLKINPKPSQLTKR